VLLALVGLVVVAIAVPGARTWAAVGLGVATTVAAALIGKVVGVAIARLRLRRDIRRVSVRLAATGRRPDGRTWDRTRDLPRVKRALSR
jgi:hypothetical protein